MTEGQGVRRAGTTEEYAAAKTGRFREEADVRHRGRMYIPKGQETLRKMVAEMPAEEVRDVISEDREKTQCPHRQKKSVPRRAESETPEGKRDMIMMFLALRNRNVS